MKRIFSSILLRALTGAFLFTLLVVGISPTQAQRRQPQPAKPAANCPRPDDTIMKGIYEQLQKDADLSTQWRQIVVTVQDGVVRLRGWTKGKIAKRKAEQIAGKTACVTKVNSQLSPVRSGSCPDGQKPCGEGVCIGENETCPIN